MTNAPGPMTSTTPALRPVEDISTRVIHVMDHRSLVTMYTNCTHVYIYMHHPTINHGAVRHLSPFGPVACNRDFATEYFIEFDTLGP